jgi:hypothetical protein
VHQLYRLPWCQTNRAPISCEKISPKSPISPFKRKHASFLSTNVNFLVNANSNIFWFFNPTFFTEDFQIYRSQSGRSTLSSARSCWIYSENMLDSTQTCKQYLSWSLVPKDSYHTMLVWCVGDCVDVLMIAVVILGWMCRNLMCCGAVLVDWWLLICTWADCDALICLGHCVAKFSCCWCKCWCCRLVQSQRWEIEASICQCCR